MNYNKKPIVIAQIMGKWVGGGVESVIMNYYKNIDRKKIQFDFICDSDSTCIPYNEIETLGGKVILVPPYKKIIKNQIVLRKLFKKNNYAIVHSNLNTLSIFSLMAAKRVGIKIRIAHNHSTSNKKEFKKNIIKSLLKPFSKIYSTHYFACGEKAGKYLFGKNIIYNKKFFIINNAIDLEKFKYNEQIRKKQRKKLNIKNNQFVVGHIGRFVTQKNHYFVIEIFKEIYKIDNNSILLLIGSGPLMNEIKNKVINSNLINNVIFLGQINNIQDVYQVIDVLILPSLYEGLSVVGIEAQASNLPCYFSDNITKELKLQKKTKFLSLKDGPKMWAKEIIKYEKDREYINETLIKKYDIKKEASKLEKNYFKLLKEVK